MKVGGQSCAAVGVTAAPEVSARQGGPVSSELPQGRAPRVLTGQRGRGSSQGLRAGDGVREGHLHTAPLTL